MCWVISRETYFLKEPLSCVNGARGKYIQILLVTQENLLFFLTSTSPSKFHGYWKWASGFNMMGSNTFFSLIFLIMKVLKQIVPQSLFWFLICKWRRRRRRYIKSCIRCSSCTVSLWLKAEVTEISWEPFLVNFPVLFCKVRRCR